jgi:hypothetical protein
MSNSHLDVNVTNLPVIVEEANPVTTVTVQEPLDVVVTNFPNDTITVSTILGGARTTTGTLITVPAGRVFMGSCEVSCSIAVAGNSQPTISVSGSGVSPSGELLRVEANGIALSTVTNSSQLGLVYIHGGDGGATVTFTAGASGLSSGSITGRLL